MRVELVFAAYVLTWAVGFGALGTSIIHCIEGGEWLLLIAVAVLPPVGIVHGIGLWFGAW